MRITDSIEWQRNRTTGAVHHGVDARRWRCALYAQLGMGQSMDALSNWVGAIGQAVRSHGRARRSQRRLSLAANVVVASATILGGLLVGIPVGSAATGSIGSGQPENQVATTPTPNVAAPTPLTTVPAATPLVNAVATVPSGEGAPNATTPAQAAPLLTATTAPASPTVARGTPAPTATTVVSLSTPPASTPTTVATLAATSTVVPTPAVSAPTPRDAIPTRDPSRPISARSAPVTALGTTTWMSIAAGWSHTCAITTTNRAYCWGYNGYGQLGDGTQDDSSTPVAVAGGYQWRQIVVAYRYTCGITTSGIAYCWGDNGLYQLGDNTPISHSVPTAVKTTVTWSKLTAGYQHVCGIATTGLGYCWGLNADGQLGDSTTVNKKVPTAISGSTKWTVLSAGSYHTCGVSDAYSAYCWGWNDYGQIGDGNVGTSLNPMTSKIAPTLVTGSKLWVNVVANYSATCGVDASYQGYCWGKGGLYGFTSTYYTCYYQYSVSSTSTQSCSPAPQPLSSTLPWKSMFAGKDNVYGVTTSNVPYGWGDNCTIYYCNNSTNIFPNINTYTEWYSAPLSLTFKYGQVFSSFSAGLNYGCGISTDRRAWCWGYNNYGQIGDGSLTARTSEVQVPDPPSVVLPVTGNLRVSNVREGSATISWATNTAVTGSVVYGLASSGAGPSTPVYDTRGSTTASTIHYVTISGLVPNTAYVFDVVSGNVTDSRSGNHYSFSTGPSLDVRTPETVTGTVAIDGGGVPADSIVYLSATAGTDTCGPISALVSSTGNASGAWNLSLGNLRTADNLAWCNYTTTSPLTIEAQAGNIGRGAVVKTVAEAKAGTTPLVVMPVATVVSAMQSGWNLIALDGTPLVPIKLSDLCSALNANAAGAPIEVARWEHGAWVSHICFTPLNETNMQTGVGYFVKLAQPATWTYDSIPTSSPKTLTMQAGWNLISMSGAIAYDAAKVITAIEAAGGSNGSVIVCTEIDRWEAGGWDPVVRASSANVYAIEGGRGYFVNLKKAVSWTPAAVAP